MKKIYFILGARDREMEAIEYVLRDLPVGYGVATKDSVVVSQDNAYKADSVINMHAASPAWRRIKNNPEYRIVTVECEISGVNNLGARIDHHKKSDAGFSIGPQNFLTASSIGQVLSSLARDVQIAPSCGLNGWDRITTTGSCESGIFEYDYCSERWFLPYSENGDPVTAKYLCTVPKNIALIAAEDHCLNAAYRGQCPGVTPDEMLKFRCYHLAKIQKTNKDRLLTIINNFRKRLKEIQKDQYSRLTQSIPGILDLTNMPARELVGAPEAARRENLPILVQISADSGGREIGIQVLTGNVAPVILNRWVEQQNKAGRKVVKQIDGSVSAIVE